MAEGRCIVVGCRRAATEDMPFTDETVLDVGVCSEHAMLIALDPAAWRLTSHVVVGGQQERVVLERMEP